MQRRIYLSLMLSVVLTACGGGGGGGGGTDSSPSGGATPQNQAPTVSIAGVSAVDEGNEIVLTANASDSDGSIASYAWAVSSTEAIDLTSVTEAETSFVAPSVTEDKTVDVTVTVTDDDGATASATITVKIVDFKPDFSISYESSVTAGGGYYAYIQSDLEINDYEINQKSFPAVSEVQYKDPDEFNRIVYFLEHSESSYTLAIDVSVQFKGHEEWFTKTISVEVASSVGVERIQLNAGGSHTVPFDEFQEANIHLPFEMPFAEISISEAGLVLSAANFYSSELNSSFYLQGTLNDGRPFKTVYQVTTVVGGEAVTASGRVLYEDVEPGSVSTVPVIAGSIVVRDSSDLIVSSSSISDDGSYQVDIPKGIAVDINYEPMFYKNGALIRVADNTDTNFLNTVEEVGLHISQNYADRFWSLQAVKPPTYRFAIVSSEVFDVNTPLSDLVLDSGYDAGVYDPVRESAAANIISNVRRALHWVDDGDLLGWVDLDVYWSPTALDSSYAWYQGGLDTSQAYASCRRNCAGYNSARIEIEPVYHEFDDWTITHELGHYVMGSISQNDSSGGERSIADYLNPMTAYSEGYADWFAEIALDNSFDSQTPEEPYVGWFNEIAVQNSLNELFNAVGKDVAKFHQAMIDSADSPEFKTIFTFIDSLHTLDPGAVEGKLGALSQWGINSIEPDGRDEIYAIPNHLKMDPEAQDVYLPVHQRIHLGELSEACVDSRNAGSRNRLGASHLGLIELESDGLYSITQEGEGLNPSILMTDAYMNSRSLSPVNGQLWLPKGEYKILASDYDIYWGSKIGIQCFTYQVNRH
ncbi:PKD domain-containing protein [Microbulbifer agarilyticus]|uniref:PKD domain-containing protein n=1 Tax=Microbulbifer agarilyticus TaxID=260552 RepID=UPI001CD7E61B|nr:PKD domain-containing protein [Microbulbifer agarilyticus]MCA0899212.1 PKD domain-containing protein [Microbulbifer agarilyticus]